MRSFCSLAGVLEHGAVADSLNILRIKLRTLHGTRPMSGWKACSTSRNRDPVPRAVACCIALGLAPPGTVAIRYSPSRQSGGSRMFRAPHRAMKFSVILCSSGVDSSWSFPASSLPSASWRWGGRGK
ncbi:hypothetical protein GQ53DRAFT_56649 [Thozetella sp. PMI_491]|nr:hypothetical protein GQ53DRAFT_56649 [Thozetella sp. PMI_491]